MKFIIVLSCILVAQFKLTAQTIRGVLVDADNQTPLPYVNIGILGKAWGTVSQLDGSFQLELSKQFDQDTLRCSMVGYEPFEMTVAAFKTKMASSNKIALKPSVEKVQEVVVESTVLNLKTRILGNKTTSKSTTFQFGKDQLGNEVGIRIKAKKKRKPMYLREFRASIASSNYEELKFRLNFYTMKNGLPDERIQTENIIVTSTIKEGLLVVDLKPYDLVIKGDFFVSLEWIEDLGKEGLSFSASLSSSPLIVRQASQANWLKVGIAGVGFTVKVKQ